MSPPGFPGANRSSDQKCDLPKVTRLPGAAHGRTLPSAEAVCCAAWGWGGLAVALGMCRGGLGGAEASKDLWRASRVGWGGGGGQTGRQDERAVLQGFLGSRAPGQNAKPPQKSWSYPGCAPSSLSLSGPQSLHLQSEESGPDCPQESFCADNSQVLRRACVPWSHSVKHRMLPGGRTS